MSRYCVMQVMQSNAQEQRVTCITVVGGGGGGLTKMLRLSLDSPNHLNSNIKFYNR